MRKFSVLCLCILAFMSANAQKVVERLDLYNEYSIMSPVFIDSTDVNGKSFDLFESLKPREFEGDFIKRLDADSEGYFHFSKNDNKTHISELSFKLFVPKMEKVSFKLISSFVL